MTFTDDRARALSGADLDVSLLAKDQYFREVAWTEPLLDEEHTKLLQRVIRGNFERLQASPNQWVLSLAKHARERLVEVYQTLVVTLARRRLFLFTSMDVLDVIQEGNLGLLNALDCYGDDEARRYSFPIFATLYVKRALSHSACVRDAFIRLPYEKHKVLLRASRVASDLCAASGRQPLLGEVAEVIGVSEDELAELIDAGERRHVQSIQAILAPEEMSEDRINFAHLYASCVADEDTRQEELAATFQRAFETVLPEKQREVVHLRYGFDGGVGEVRSQSLIAEMTGIDEDYVSKCDREVKRRLEEVLEPVVLPDGRLSCVLQDHLTEDTCTTREAATLLGVSVAQVSRYTLQGFLPSELRPSLHGGRMVRVFKKSDVLAFQEQQAIAPIKLSARRRENASLAAARRSALLPSVVA